MASIAKDVLQVIVDPTDQQSLHYIETEHCFYNERSRKRYAVAQNGIAILLADSAESVSGDEHERLMALIASGKSISTGTNSSEE
jgi:uncharacterized protein YbaR (Trm112 family)